MFFNFVKRKRAFSLAEVLTTLIVVGVIAILMVPTINNSFYRIMTQTSFVDTMKEANKGLMNYTIRTTQNMKPSATDLFIDGNIAKRLSKQFSAKKEGTNCWGGIDISIDLDGKNKENAFRSLSCFIDADEVIYATELISSDCSANLYNIDDDSNHKLKRSCGILYFDVNGKKAPNVMGRDIFAFVITDTVNASLYPIGGSLINPAGLNGTIMEGVSHWCAEKDAAGNCKEGTCGVTSQDGRSCAGRITEEGMKVNYINRR